MADVTAYSVKWQDFLNEGREYVANCNPMPPRGHLTKVTGLVMEGVMPTDPAHVLPLGGKRKPMRRSADRAKHLPVGDMLLGRVLDGAGKPLDQLGPLLDTESAPLQSRPFTPLGRASIDTALDVGVGAIN